MQKRRGDSPRSFFFFFFSIARCFFFQRLKATLRFENATSLPRTWATCRVALENERSQMKKRRASWSPDAFEPMLPSLAARKRKE